jgi:hypothetical protein
MKFLNYKKIIFVIGVLLFFSGAGTVKAANIGDIVNFNVDKSFDASSRTQLPATLVKIESKLYFYIEKPLWDSETPAKQDQILADLDNLSNEFDNNIYPNITSVFGTEWTPGIDNDPKISILFESMNSTEGGYFREADEYDKLQLPDSNQREMLYITASNIDDPNVKVILAHEFMHLVIYNQKNKIQGTEEETWLNEGLSDYTSTLLGYDNPYAGSNLQSRVNDFIQNPSDSLVDFQNSKYDFATVNLFMQYLVDRYGVKILSDSLKSKAVGIESIDEALQENGAKESFAQVFTDWTIALAINDCSQNPAYCYLDQNLKDLRINPTLIFLPLAGDSSLSTTNVTKSWAGNWQKIIGGSGDLKLDFSSLPGLNFQVPYIIYDKSNNYSVNFLSFDSNGKSQIDIPDFGTKYKSLIIIPSLQTKASDLDAPGLIYPYTFTVSITGQDAGSDQALMQKLLAEIDSLKKQIADIMAQKQATPVSQNNSCSQLNNNLYLGMKSADVTCLQEFLKNQGTDIYPEGLVTGNFGNLTKASVIKFQSEYGIAQTGFVGPLTRNKINSLLNGG